jgi:hypothetical protein
VEKDTIFFGCYFCNIGDIGIGGLICLRVDSILSNGNDVGPVFDLESERPPMETIGDEVSPYTLRFVFGAFHLDYERMDLMVVAVVRYNVDDCRGIRLDEDFLLKGSLFHASDYT